MSSCIGSAHLHVFGVFVIAVEYVSKWTGGWWDFYIIITSLSLDFCLNDGMSVHKTTSISLSKNKQYYCFKTTFLPKIWNSRAQEKLYTLANCTHYIYFYYCLVVVVWEGGWFIYNICNFSFVNGGLRYFATIISKNNLSFLDILTNEQQQQVLYLLVRRQSSRISWIFIRRYLVNTIYREGPLSQSLQHYLAASWGIQTPAPRSSTSSRWCPRPLLPDSRQRTSSVGPRPPPGWCCRGRQAGPWSADTR